MAAGPSPTTNRDTAPVPAGPRGSRLLGNMGSYNADPLAFMTDTARRYGDIVPLRFGPIRAILLSDPRDIESVLVEHSKSFHKSRGTHRLATLLGNGIFLSEGDYWLRHRRLMQPAFHRAAVERYGEIMIRRIAGALERWSSLDVLDVVRETRRLALEIATETLFGNDVSEQEARAIGSAIEVAAAQLQTRVSSLKMYVPDWVPTAGNRRMNAAIDEIDRLVFRIINDRRGRPGERGDLLALLLSESDQEDGGMTDRELRDEVVTLLVAGHETTALTLAWAIYEIAVHPEVGDALRTETDEVLEGRAPTAGDIQRLPVAASCRVRDAAPLSRRVPHRPTGDRGRGDWRPADQAADARPAVSVGTASRPRDVRRSPGVSARPMARWTAQGARPWRLLPIRARPTDVHRDVLRQPRADAGTAHDPSALSVRADVNR